MLNHFWERLLAAMAANESAIKLLFFYGTALAGVWYWAHRNIKPKVDKFIERRKNHARTEDLHTEALNFLVYQMKPNSGGSFFDRVISGLEKLTTSNGRIEERLDHFMAQQNARDALSDEAYWEADAGGLLTKVNPKACELFGCTAEELLGANWKTIVHPDDRTRANHEWMDAVKDGRVHDATFRIVRDAGNVIVLQVHGRPIFAGGRLASYFGTFKALPQSVPVPVKEHLLRVLWVEDSSDVTRMARAHFRSQVPGVELVTTETSGDALQRFVASRQMGHAFDMVILDEHLEGSVSGVDLARTMRREEQRSGSHHARLVFCTGDPDKITPAIMHEVNAMKCLTKPVRMEEIELLIKGGL